MKKHKEIINVRKILETHNPKNLEGDRTFGYPIAEKWRPHFSRGWYGFDMGWAPDSWFKIIDEFLDRLKEVDPEFKIHQIKIKFGGIRIYLSFSEKITEDMSVISYVNQQIAILEHELFHESLIY